MNSFKLSDRAKVLIVIAIAIFEITFVQLTKDRPRIPEPVDNEIQQVADQGGVIVRASGETIIEIDHEPESKSDQTLEVHYLNVGQGDAAYIGYGDFDMVIDGGTNEDGDRVVDYLRAYVTGPIELVVGSHPHEDHIGGLDDVMKAYPVKTLIDSGEVKDTKTYRDYMAAATAGGATILNDEDLIYQVDDLMKVEIIEAVDDDATTNNNSVVVKVTYDQVSFLFTGDLEEEIESSILLKPIKATVFKAGHHGSDTSNSDMFLRRVQPEMIVISAGLDNKYGHPKKEALENMLEQTQLIYGTWENGTIIVTTNGKSVSTEASKLVTLEDVGAQK